MGTKKTKVDKLNPKKIMLKDLAEKYGTDKLTHGYIDYYERHLPLAPARILEVGVALGASLHMWAEAFPMAEIHCVDLFQENEALLPVFQKKGYICHKGRQEDIEFLSSIKPAFDVIIDDGSHNMEQQITMDHLFVNNLKSGGIYIIEDLHTSEDAFFYGEHPKKDRTLHALKYFQKHKKWNTCFIGSHEQAYWKSTLDRIEIFDDKIAFLYKK